MKKLFIILLGLSLVAAGAWVIDRRIRTDAEIRAANFITAHYLVRRAAIDTLDPPPNDIRKVLNRSWGGNDHPLLKYFPDGLIFKVTPPGFRLEEPEARRISLFHSDRLVASDTEGPQWEKSGTKVWKFEGQEIPGGFLHKQK